MGEDLEVVAFERRGRLGLGALKGGGDKNARLVDDLGETLKVSQDKVLHRFKARVQDGDPRAIKDRLRALQKELQAQLGAKGGGKVDLDLLWDSLEDERVYRLSQLAELYFGEATGQASDMSVAALVATLGDGDSEEPPYHFRSRPGGLARTDKDTFDKIRARLEAERRRREREAAFRAWFEQAAQLARRNDHERPFASCPEDLREHLQVLAEYALGGDRAPQAARARRLAQDMGIADPDEALILLERGGGLPKDANELPHRAGIPIQFNQRARAEAEAIAASAAPELGKERVDFRGKLTTAIDDATTQDVDDGFSVWEEEGALALAIHIADVAATVEKGSELDQEAQRRATTVYFPGQTIPMIPLPLHRARLSLDAGAERAVISYVTRVGPDGALVPGRFVRGIARVDRRLTYEQTLDPPEEWRAPLGRLVPLAEKLRAARAKAGAVLLELPDLKITIDDAGEPELTLISSETPGHRLVSELMVLYNHQLALALREARRAAAFRTQPEPVHPITISPQDPLFPVRARRGLPPTVIDVDAHVHRTLGLEAYVQGSSPIRRFGDLIAQRQIVSVLDGKPPAYAREEVRELLADLERSEKGSRRLEDDRDLYWVCRWFDRRRKDTFGGVVSRSLDSGRGLVYVPEINMELSLGDPDPPQDIAEGQAIRVRVRRSVPRRRSVILEPA